MSSEVVPSVGMVLPGDEGPLLDRPKIRGMTAVGAVVAAATTTAAIFAAGEEVSVRTRVANEEIFVVLSIQRSNDNAAGFGTYRARIDGAAAGPANRLSEVGITATSLTLAGRIIVPAAGVHPINAQVVSAAAGNETVVAGAQMMVFADEFA